MRRRTWGLYAPRSSTAQQYGTQVPRPGVENNGALKIEMVQRCAAGWTLKRYHNTSSVSSMLLDLGWRSLEQRRADSRLTLLYKIHMKGHVPIEASKHLRPMKRRSRHSHSSSFIPLSTSSSSHRLSFYPRTITQWNSLPQSIFGNDDLTYFKHSVSSISHNPLN